MSTLKDAREDERRQLSHRVSFMVAAAPPPESILAAMATAGFHNVHVYGLTEVYGPAMVNEWKDEWNNLDNASRAVRQARQGVRYHALEGLAMMDPTTMEPSSADELGKVMLRGNIVMKRYLKNPFANRSVFAGGWFHSGDLGVVRKDRYTQLKDRSKDIIISGGENISSKEIENVVGRQPAAQFAAVVAKPDKKRGETPCAFVEKRRGHESVKEDELLAFCRVHFAMFKAPQFLIFAQLPKTSTGTTQTFFVARTS